MALVLNGSGSITGLSAGGLPDASITTDELANASVTAVKLAAGVGGKVLQVVQNTYSVETTSTSSSFVSTGLSASITPSSSSSKVLVMAATSGRSGYTNIMTIFRGTVSGTNLGNGNSGMVLLYTGGEIRGQVALQYLDSPATTSSQTYTLGMRSSNGTGIYAQENNGQAVMILMEIAA